MNLFLKKVNKKSFKKAFTLVELLVTITIFVIITGIVLINSNKFDSSVLLNNFSYDVALTIKQAQSYGVNVKETSSGSFDTSYGVYFDLNRSDKNYIFFADTTIDKKYSSNGGDTKICLSNDAECIQKYSMQRGTRIQSMCVGTNDLDCFGVNILSIIFTRPSLNANIYKDGSNTPNINDTYAKITLAALDGTISSVVITSIGQIYVKK